MTYSLSLLPNTSHDNKHKYQCTHHCGGVCVCVYDTLDISVSTVSLYVCMYACMYAVCNLILMCVFTCVIIPQHPSKHQWQTEIAHRRTNTQQHRLLHHFQTWISDIFLSAAHQSLRAGSGCSSHWNDLVPSHDFWHRGRSHQKGFELLHLFHHMCYIITAPLSIFTCNFWLIGMVV